MKKNLFFLLLIIVHSINSQAQPSIQWQKCFGGSQHDFANSIRQTSNGGYIVAGFSFSADSNVTGHHGTNSSEDFWIVNLDSTGMMIWEKSLGGFNEDGPYSVQQTLDGGYIAAGYSFSNNGDVSGNHGAFGDCWLVKLDTAGTIEWQKCLGGSEFETATSVEQTSDGGFVIAGYTNSNNGDVSGHHGTGNSDWWVVKLDTSHAIQWQKCLGGSNHDQASAIQQTNDGGYILAGNSLSNDFDVSGHRGTNSNTDYWVVKLDTAGGIVWQKSLGGTLNDEATSVQQTTDGGYIVAGRSNSNDSDVTNHQGTTSSPDCWIVKLDSSGSVEWQNSLGGTDYDEATSIQQTTDDGYVFTGRTNSADGDVTGNHGGGDYWIVMLDHAGVLQWQKCLGGSGFDLANSVRQTSDGGFVSAGYSASNNGNVSGNHGSNDYWVVKLFPAPLSTPEVQNSIGEFQIMPNPFFTETFISFGGSDSKIIGLFIRDMQGREIKQLNTRTINSGAIEVSWDATDNKGVQVANGIYFITLISDRSSETRKVVVLAN